MPPSPSALNPAIRPQSRQVPSIPPSALNPAKRPCHADYPWPSRPLAHPPHPLSSALIRSHPFSPVLTRSHPFSPGHHAHPLPHPTHLAGSNAGDIKRAASVASGFSSFLGPARSFLRSQSWWDEKPLADGEEEEDDEDEVLELPPLIVSKGVPPFLYDAYGDYNGVKHLLLTEEGEPWGVWDPEAKVAKKRTFDEDGDLVEET